MKDVFRFSFMQQLKLKSSQVTTLVVALLLFLCAGLVAAIADVKTGEFVPEIDKVYICDSSLLHGSDYELMKKMSDDKKFDSTEFINSEDTLEKTIEIAKAAGTKNAVAEIKSDENNKITIRIIRLDNYDGKKKSYNKLESFINSNIKFVVYEHHGFSEEVQNEIVKDVSFEETSVSGDDKSSIESIIKTRFIPLFYSFVMYIILLMYGQSISRNVVLEKDSKMMETILVMAKPYDLIFGKVLSLWLFSLLQLMVWIISLAGGFATGIMIAYSAFGTETSSTANLISKIFDSGSGFSVLSVILSIVILMIGILMYYSLAALFGSFASKSEEVNNYFGIYSMIIVFSWIFPYMNSLNGNEKLVSILRYIPFTAPFTSAADTLIGNMKISESFITMGILLISTVAVVYLAAKIYKILVLYKGEPVKIKDIPKLIKMK